MKKKYILLFVLSILFLQNICTKGSPDSLAKESTASLPTEILNVSFPKSEVLGNYITIHFEGQKKIENAWLSFYDMEQKKLQTIEAFPIDKNEQKWAAVMAIAVWWKVGEHILQASAIIDSKLFEEKTKFIIIEKKFKEFKMKLNSKNNAILKNKGKQKKDEQDKFKKIIKTQNKKNLFTKGLFIMPFKIKRISSTFAEKRTTIYLDGKKTVSRHWGIDYPAPKGTSIVSPANGKVVLAEKRIVTGWTIIIEHAPSIYTLYYHLHKIDVKEGDFLKQGDTIAQIGSTGFSTGPHLHWELRINEIPCNPELLLEKELY